MHSLKSSLTILILAATADAQVDMPASVKARPGKLMALTIKNVPAKVAWQVLPADSGMDAFREHDPDLKTIRLRILAEHPGTFWLVVSSANGEIRQQVCAIIVDGPPVPIPVPVPVPPSPEPTDDLYKSLKAAWTQESTADKAKRADLAALYQQSAELARTDQTLTLQKQLFDRMHAARLKLIGDALPGVRKVITAHLDAHLPRNLMSPLDDATRKLDAQHFDLIADRLMRLP